MLSRLWSCGGSWGNLGEMGETERDTSDCPEGACITRKWEARDTF